MNRCCIAIFTITCVVSLAGMGKVHGQDLEKIKKAKVITYSGNLSVNNTFYTASGIPNRRDPYFWQVNANVNFNFLGIIDAPFSISLSQQNKNFDQPQPFNRFGLSPTYKAFTGHFGHRSMSFSEFTLAGAMFLGAGVEYKPRNIPWQVSAMYGRLAKAVASTTSSGLVFARPAFRRTGYGVKAGHEKEDLSAHVIMFTASDDPQSIPADSLAIRPQGNLVLGLVTKFPLLKVIAVEIDYAHSMFTRDLNAPENVLGEYSFKNNINGLFQFNSSSLFADALSARATFNGDLFQLFLAYKRIDPEFNTLGSAFMNNDLEDMTAGISLPLFNNKISLTTSMGVQRNNLNDQLTADVVRFAFSAAASITFGEKLTTAFSYANFSTDTRQSAIRDDLLSDTLRFFQVTQNGTANVNYRLGPTGKSSLYGTLSLQDATDSDNNNSTFTTVNAGYATTLGQSWSLSLSMNFNQNISKEAENIATGPVLGLGRSFFKNKVRTNISVSALESYLDEKLQSRIYNARWSASTTLGKRHSLSMNAFYIYKEALNEQTETMEEIRGSLNYAFRL